MNDIILGNPKAYGKSDDWHNSLISPACGLQIFNYCFFWIVSHSSCLLLWLCFWHFCLWNVPIWNRDLIMFGKVAPQTRSTSPSSRVSLWMVPRRPLAWGTCSPARNDVGYGEAVEDWVGDGVHSNRPRAVIEPGNIGNLIKNSR